MIITHPTMHPFFIEIEGEGNHTLKKHKKAIIEGNPDTISTEGYFHSVDLALKKLVKLKVLEGEDVITLDTYIVKIETLINSISKIKL